jgi:polysaccharide pyruvyl transferase WcaK-like protein
LLKCAIDQYRRAAHGRSLDFVLHVNKLTPLLTQLQSAGGFTANEGIQQAYWRLITQLRHSRLPLDVREVLAAFSLPSYLLGTAAIDYLDSRKALQQIASADLLHIFGGTNFTFQWNALNMPFFAATSAMMKLRGKPTYLGPQQYGPMTDAQLLAFKTWLSTCVSDWRTRNPKCLELLGGDPNEHLISDEVYSNRGLYPIEHERPASGGYVMVNLRGGSMSDNSTFNSDELDNIADALARVYAQTDKPYRFFAVSTAELTEDRRSYDALAQRLAGRAPIENVGRVASEHELMALAGKAYGCISMSFHGCILCGFRGIPAIPITSGAYYDHKYIGFDQYGDGQPIPILSLARPTSDDEVGAVVSYLKTYDAGAAARRRTRAAELIEAYYQSIVVREL